MFLYKLTTLIILLSSIVKIKCLERTLIFSDLSTRQFNEYNLNSNWVFSQLTPNVADSCQKNVVTVSYQQVSPISFLELTANCMLRISVPLKYFRVADLTIQFQFFKFGLWDPTIKVSIQIQNPNFSKVYDDTVFLAQLSSIYTYRDQYALLDISNDGLPENYQKIYFFKIKNQVFDDDLKIQIFFENSVYAQEKIGIREFQVHGTECNQNCLLCLANVKDDFCLKCFEGGQIQQTQVINSQPIGQCLSVNTHFYSVIYIHCTQGFDQPCTEYFQCSDQCLTCWNGGIYDCLSCVTSQYLYKGRCLQQCPQGSYQNLENGVKICTPCHWSCLSCTEGSSMDCVKCNYAAIRFFFDSQQGNSIFEGVCCTNNCIKCTDLDRDTCLECVTPFVLDNSQCKAICPIGQYNPTLSDGSQSSFCKLCDRSCQECFGISDQRCQTCRPLYFLSSEQWCLVTCPDNYFGFQKQCLLKCPLGYYPNKKTRKCEECHLICQTCFGPEITQCQSCFSPFFLSISSCIDECPQGEFRDEKSNTCQTCLIENCQKCDNTGFKCLECGGLFSYLNFCFRVCPQSDTGVQLFGNRSQATCVQKCRDGQYGDFTTGYCETCHRACLICVGRDQYSCYQCSQFYYLHATSCLKTCPPCFLKDPETGTCVANNYDQKFSVQEDIYQYYTLGRAVYIASFVFVGFSTSFNYHFNWNLIDFLQIGVSLGTTDIQIPRNLELFFQGLWPVTMVPENLISIQNSQQQDKCNNEVKTSSTFGQKLPPKLQYFGFRESIFITCAVAFLSLIFSLIWGVILSNLKDLVTTNQNSSFIQALPSFVEKIVTYLASIFSFAFFFFIFRISVFILSFQSIVLLKFVGNADQIFYSIVTFAIILLISVFVLAISSGKRAEFLQIQFQWQFGAIYRDLFWNGRIKRNFFFIELFTQFLHVLLVVLLFYEARYTYFALAILHYLSLVFFLYEIPFFRNQYNLLLTLQKIIIVVLIYLMYLLNRTLQILKEAQNYGGDDSFYIKEPNYFDSINSLQQETQKYGMAIIIVISLFSLLYLLVFLFECVSKLFLIVMEKLKISQIQKTKSEIQEAQNASNFHLIGVQEFNRNEIFREIRKQKIESRINDGGEVEDEIDIINRSGFPDEVDDDRQRLYDIYKINKVEEENSLSHLSKTESNDVSLLDEEIKEDELNKSEFFIYQVRMKDQVIVIQSQVSLTYEKLMEKVKFFYEHDQINKNDESRSSN